MDFLKFSIKGFCPGMAKGGLAKTQLSSEKLATSPYRRSRVPHLPCEARWQFFLVFRRFSGFNNDLKLDLA